LANEAFDRSGQNNNEVLQPLDGHAVDNVQVLIAGVGPQHGKS